jgi:hypothetical protein
MSQHTSKVLEYTINTGVGTQSITQTFDKFDLSYCDALLCKLYITKAAEDAGDTFDVYVEERTNEVTWNQRGRFERITGDMSPSTTAPEERTLVISAKVNLDTAEESYEDTGSTGGTSLAAGTVRNGPFAGKLFSSSGPPFALATHRVRLEVTDADNDGDFEGTVTIYAVTDIG